MLLCTNQNVFGCRNNNYLSGFFSKKCIFSYDNLNHLIVRAPYTSYNLNASAIAYDKPNSNLL